MKPNKIIFLLLGCLFLASTSFAAISDKTNELQQINNIIKSLKSNLTSSQRKQNSLQQKLRKNEIAVGNTSIKLRQTQLRLTKQQKLLQQLKYDDVLYQKQLITQQKDMVAQIRATYMLGNKAYLKMLLNHQDPHQLSRTFVYYDYIQKFRNQRIEALQYTLRKIKRNRKDIKQQTQKLLVLKNEQQHEYKKLLNIKSQRKQLLTTINKDIKTKQQKLTKLISDQKTLEKLITKLKAAQISAEFAQPLGKLKRKLHWPTKGGVQYLYGKKISHSQLQWTGDIINAPEGQNVYAISNGKVIFSQWLQGYGLMLIIDHGHGFMSLYGRNNSLYKKIGDVVQKDDLIATVGNSGGYDKPGLYFAVRHNGKPVNPKLWCRG